MTETNQQHIDCRTNLYLKHLPVIFCFSTHKNYDIGTEVKKRVREISNIIRYYMSCSPLLLTFKLLDCLFTLFIDSLSKKRVTCLCVAAVIPLTVNKTIRGGSPFMDLPMPVWIPAVCLVWILLDLQLLQIKWIHPSCKCHNNHLCWQTYVCQNTFCCLDRSVTFTRLLNWKRLWTETE